MTGAWIPVPARTLAKWRRAAARVGLSLEAWARMWLDSSAVTDMELDEWQARELRENQRRSGSKPLRSKP